MSEATGTTASGFDCDVAILGGGLAGLTLAIQLRQRQPGLRVTVLERHAHPVREAAFKVGESTVEIGAHYLAHVLGLREHLDSHQLRKFGFRFFFSEGHTDLDRCTELGVSRLLPTPSWQLDRGRFENFLGEHARALGVDFRDATTVRGFDLGAKGDAHVVRLEHAGQPRTLRARWLVDAAGRAGLLKRKLDLAETNDHDVHAAWWRVDGCIDPEAWSQDPAWHARCDPPARWRSTNHMCGPGYWFWLIPLASNAHSLGIVCDGALHPLERINTHAKAMEWLHRHQPGVAAALEQPGHGVQDFMFMRHFSHGCKQVFSADRWAITGEAGVFLDPFYSPGTDFIALSNTYICDLVEKDLRGEPVGMFAAMYQQLYFSFFQNTMTLYQGQYPMFGDALLMPLKVIWDYTFYWALLAPLYFGERQADIAMLGRLRATFQHGSDLNRAMQAMLRDWHAARDEALQPDRRFLDQYSIDWFHEMNRALNDPLDDDAFAARITANLARMRQLAGELLAHARARHPQLPDHGLTALLGELPAAAPLLPPDWFRAGNEVRREDAVPA